LWLADAQDVVDLLDGVGRHDRVAVMRLERWVARLRVRDGGRSGCVIDQRSLPGRLGACAGNVAGATR
jgi:hypothetical protein